MGVFGPGHDVLLTSNLVCRANLQQLEREIDRTGGMSQLTDRNQVDTGLGDRANSLQIYASASLKLETRTPEGHAGPHLGRVHIIEEDDVYPRELREFTDLL